MRWVAVGRKGSRHLVKRETKEHMQRSHPHNQTNQQVPPGRKRKPQEQDNQINNKKQRNQGEEVLVEETEEFEDTVEMTPTA